MKFFFLFLMAICFSASGGAVIWNYYQWDFLQLEGAGEGVYRFMMDDSQNGFLIEIAMSASKSTTKPYKTIVSNKSWDCLLNGLNWVRMYEGDLVCAETATGLPEDSYFHAFCLDNPYMDVSNDIQLPRAGGDFYLGMAISVDACYVYPDYDANKDYEDMIMYGWAKFHVENDEVSLVSSCLRRDGGSIVVGVPEPNTGILAFCGIALLLKRRRR